MKFSDKIDKLLIKNNIKNLRQLANETEIPYTTLWDYYTNPARLEKANLTYIRKIANRLNCSMDYLAYDDVLTFDNATPVDVSDDVVKIPVLGVIKAGIPIEAQEDIIEYIEIPKQWTNGGKKFYGLKISGDSMFPKYQEDDIVIFEQNNDTSLYNGKDCAIMINSTESTFKKLLVNEQGVVLQPYNSAYDIMMFSKEQVEELPIKVVGIAKEKRTKIN